MSIDIHHERLLVIDFGSQYTQLIARRIREAGVYCEIHPFDVTDAFVTEFNPRGVVLSGGPESVTEGWTPRIPEAIFLLDVPLLGICYGMHAMAEQLGGRVAGSDEREFGHAKVAVEEGMDLLAELPGLDGSELDVWMSHGDKVVELPEGFAVGAGTTSAPIAAMVNPQRRWYGVQFHPEVTHTQDGAEILRRFAREICGCTGLWTPENIIEEAVAAVQALVGPDGKVVLGLSGGVDSSVVAALLSRAIGERLTCVFVDNGLLRLGEREEVEKTFRPSNVLSLNLVTVDAADEFLSNLKGLTDPEDKRKAIGATFIDVFDREAHRIEDVAWLAQGTIYPDVIESAASGFGKAHVIKSHHNVGGLPERMKLKLVEPLRELFKDEVRKVGLALGLPREMVFRHPFPGPGLGVRILGEVRKDYADTLRRADAIFIEELRNADYYDRVSQAFTVFLPVRSVGVVGDARRYAYVIALRAVETIDFMTARWARLPYDLIGHVSDRIMNEISEVSRVVYDVSSKPPATIEWE
ncbi:MAG: glutamine-hydrolyzing GMP synthase [Gammaproteobacteria bacterium]|nr:MAG: glutamine-hydrolyzing GMP synthase [Gammaproteobacteria bacterium]TDJ43164.1 MAG: glutamine-hydrolyzing GMP synthase [Gammaproteobacteria bacterium]